MPCQAQVPAAHVLVATVHRFARSTDAAFALVHLVDKIFAVLHTDHSVVPESEQPGLKAGGPEDRQQIFNLCGLAGAVHPGEADQQGTGGHGCPTGHVYRPTSVAQWDCWPLEAWMMCPGSVRTRCPRQLR